MKTLTATVDGNTISIDAQGFTMIELLGLSDHIKLWAQVQDAAILRGELEAKVEEAKKAQAAKAD